MHRLVSACKIYNIQSEGVIIKRIPYGLRNKTYLLTLNNRPCFVLKQYSTADSTLTPSNIESITQVVERARQAGAPLPEYLRGSDGKYIQFFRHRGTRAYCTVSKYLDVKCDTMRQSSLKDVALFAHALSSFHKKMKKSVSPSVLPEYDPYEKILRFEKKSTVSAFVSYVKKTKGQEESEMFYSYYLNELNYLVKYLDENKKRMWRNLTVNHGDFNFTNVCVDNNTIKAIFDFDAVVVAPPSLDLGLTAFYFEEHGYDSKLLIDTLSKEYFKNKQLIRILKKDILFFMRFRAFVRMMRYLTHYRFKERSGPDYIHYQKALERIKLVDY